MTDILLLRHGKSDWGPPVPDFERPLLDRGKHDAQRVGAWLARDRLLPDKVVTSPARRALETAEKCVKAAGLTTAIIEPEPRLYEASLQTLREVLRVHCDGLDRLLLVGHNPGLDALVLDMVKAPPPLTASGKLMTTAALAHLRLTPGKKRAELVALVRPADLPASYAYEGPDGSAYRDRPDYYYRQSAVIPVRQVGGQTEVLMIAKRDGKRRNGTKWSLPKGIVEPGLSPAESAAREAVEEAGAEGIPLPDVRGSFELEKWGGVCRVLVYVMPVSRLRPEGEWESHKRVRRWFPLAEAVARCRYSALAAIIAGLGERADTTG